MKTDHMSSTEIVDEQRGALSARSFVLVGIISSFMLVSMPITASAYALSYFKRESPKQAEKTLVKYGEMINIAALLHDFDEKMILSVIVVESEGHPGAVSNRGAQGLMQLMPGTARAMGAKDPSEPFQNILAGTKYLKSLEDIYGFDMRESLVAYNMGPSRAKRWLSQYEPEDSLYVQKVMHIYGLLSQADEASTVASSSPITATGLLSKPAMISLADSPELLNPRRTQLTERN